MPAWAQTQSVAPRRIVEVTVMGPAEDAKVLEATIRELLARLQLTMAAEKTAPPASLLETVVIDLTNTYGTKVVVKNAAGSTVLDRTIQHGDTPAIQREQIAHAVRGAAEAEILEDDDRVAGRAPPIPTTTAPVSTMQPLAPATTQEPPPPPPPPTPVVTTIVNPPDKAEAQPKPKSKYALEVGTFAGAGFFADEAVAARVGGSIAFMSRAGWRPWLAVTGLYAFPFDTGTPDVTSHTKLFSLRVLPGFRPWHWKQFGVDVAAGAGFDMMNVSPGPSTLPESDLGRTTTRYDFVMTAQAIGYWAIANDVAITLSGVLDVDPASRTYVFQNRDVRQEILSPWHVRPMLLAGLSFTALGGGR